MDRGHETFGDAEIVVNDLGQRGEAVRSARGVGNDILTGVLGVVDAHDEHGGVILRGSGHDDLLAAIAGHVRGGLLLVGENTGGLAHVMGTGRAPRDVGGVLLGEDLDNLTVDDEVAILGLDLIKNH